MTARLDHVQPANSHTAPGWVRAFSRVLDFLLQRGVPLGPNALVTITGRTSGLPRTTPLAIVEGSGRRFVWSPWGDVHWVRNLRVAGRATVNVRGRSEVVTATELDLDARVAFFRGTLSDVARAVPFGYWFVRLVDGTDLNGPATAAKDRPVFELTSSREG
jgi:deazaflavin-dependent oxidoreductase (nitroreductase family)